MFTSRSLERELCLKYFDAEDPFCQPNRIYAPDGRILSSVTLKLNPSKENDCAVFTSLKDAELWLSRLFFANAYRLQRCEEVGRQEGDYFLSLWRQKKAILKKWLEILEGNSIAYKRSYASVVKNTPS